MFFQTGVAATLLIICTAGTSDVPEIEGATGSQVALPGPKCAECVWDVVKCMTDKDCGDLFKKQCDCMKANKGQPVYNASCMLPQTPGTDKIYGCFTVNNCMPIPKTNASKECLVKQQDHRFRIDHMEGKWWVVAAFRSSSGGDCADCQTAVFTRPKGAVPWQNHANLTLPDVNGQPFTLRVLENLTQPTTVEDRKAWSFYPVGFTYDAPFFEKWCAVDDSSQDLFVGTVMFYFCGQEVAGEYTSALLLSRTPTISERVKAYNAKVASRVLGWDYERDFCVIDNSCSSVQSPAIVV